MDTRAAMQGAVAGVAATAAMSAVMVAGSRAGLMRDQPPKRIARKVLLRAKYRRRPGEGVLGAVTHFGFGATAGAVFGLATRRGKANMPLGVAYALGIWLAGYQGWVPGLNILPPLHRDRPGRRLVMGAGHVVYGVALVAALNRLRARRTGRRQGRHELSEQWERLPGGVAREPGPVPAR